MNTKQIDTGGPAFPSPDSTRLAVGMSLRDWFAGKALEGILANTSDGVVVDNLDKNFCAKFSYEMADAMIKERCK